MQIDRKSHTKSARLLSLLGPHDLHTQISIQLNTEIFVYRQETSSPVVE